MEEKYSEGAKKEVAVAQHQFLYSKKDDYRTSWLKKLASSMPITTDKKHDECMAVYVDDLSLPDIKKTRDRGEWCLVQNIYECFIILSILLEVVNKTVSDLAISSTGKEEQNNNELYKFARRMNMFVRDDVLCIDSIGELGAIIEQSKEYCRRELEKRAVDSSYEIDIDGLMFWPIDIDMCMDEFASCVLGSERKMIIILDFPTGDISSKLMATVNDIVLMRTFYWLMLSVEVNQWTNYYGSTGRPILDIHDYIDIDLDGSYKETCDEVVRRRYLDFDC